MSDLTTTTTTTDKEDFIKNEQKLQSISICGWCISLGKNTFSLKINKFNKGFCNESCFFHWRRAIFKQKSFCDWCKQTFSDKKLRTIELGRYQVFQICSQSCNDSLRLISSHINSKCNNANNNNNNNNNSKSKNGEDNNCVGENSGKNKLISLNITKSSSNKCNENNTYKLDYNNNSNNNNNIGSSNTNKTNHYSLKTQKQVENSCSETRCNLSSIEISRSIERLSAFKEINERQIESHNNNLISSLNSNIINPFNYNNQINQTPAFLNIPQLKQSTYLQSNPYIDNSFIQQYMFDLNAKNMLYDNFLKSTTTSLNTSSSNAAATADINQLYYPVFAIPVPIPQSTISTSIEQMSNLKRKSEFSAFSEPALKSFKIEKPLAVYHTNENKFSNF